MRKSVSRPMLERLPVYVAYLEKIISDGTVYVSSSRIARALSFGEVQVRKELAFVSGAGKPRVGYNAGKLLADLKSFLGGDKPSKAVIVGAGRLGRALLGYESFEEVGVKISAAFDINVAGNGEANILPLRCLEGYCREESVEIGIITVPKAEAQSVCDIMVKAGIRAIWNFAPVTLTVPLWVTVINEKLAISLSQLRQQINR